MKRAKVAEISKRRLEDIEGETKNPKVKLTDSASQALGVLSKAFSGATQVAVISDRELAKIEIKRIQETEGLTQDQKNEQIEQSKKRIL